MGMMIDHSFNIDEFKKKIRGESLTRVDLSNCKISPSGNIQLETKDDNKTCRTCIHYHPFQAEPRGKCRCDRLRYFVRGVDDERRTDTLHYWDVDEQEAHFNVGADFGCIHYKEKT